MPTYVSVERSVFEPIPFWGEVVPSSMAKELFRTHNSKTRPIT